MQKNINPYEFLKSRRPDEFSDTKLVKKASLDKSFFDYYLDTITNRSEEKIFEHFCKRIAESQLCPNLLPQTGPTGGGDSKVDTETYPVADNIALTWYSGIGRAASSERWGFAISAKRDWKPKVKSDVANIISTNRDYKIIFFMSNQYIPDKKRAATEDELYAKYGITVRILDRTWFLDKVFSNHLEKIVVESFGLSDSFLDIYEIGPMDYKKQKELEVLENEIKDYISKGTLNIAVVENAIQSAILSRELELPSETTNGRFIRASSIIEKYGNNIHEKECTYQWAWTLFWWCNDFEAFYKKYCEYEVLVLGGINFLDLERLTNLWMNLFMIIIEKPDLIDIKPHTDKLISEYERFINDKNRPGAALEARANYVFVRLLLGHNTEELIIELKDVIDKSKGVLEFSMGTISKMFLGTTPAFEDSPNYNMIFETIVEITSIREQESVAAKLLLGRGKHLINSKPYSAIRYIGRALFKLYKEENKGDLLLGLLMMGSACESVELLFAARGYYMNGFFIGFTHYMRSGYLNPIIAEFSKYIKLIELKLGRVPESLEWNKLNRIINGMLSSSGYKRSEDEGLKHEDLYDAVLGMLLFRSKYTDLERLASLPESLEHNGLYMSSISLKYALGYIDEDIKKAYDNDEVRIKNYMEKWYNQPAKEQIPNQPSFGLEETEILKTKIMGCEIYISTKRKFPCIELAESILAATEGFLSTGIQDEIFSLTPKAFINIEYLDSDKFKVEFKEDESSSTLKYMITCSDFKYAEFQNTQNTVREFIFKFVTELIAHIVIFKDMENQLKKIVAEDLVFDRSLIFTGSIFITADLLGKNSVSINRWLVSEGVQYPIVRKDALKIKSQQEIEEEMPKQRIRLTGEKIPHGAFDSEKVTHKDIEILTVINIPLWNRAKWQGVLYGSSMGDESPIMALLFTNKDAAIEIFKEWISLVGFQDKKDIIQVGFIKGINEMNPCHYKAIISPNVDALVRVGKSKLISIPTRFLPVQVDNDFNLKNFEIKIKQMHPKCQYYLMPAYLDNATGEPVILEEYRILKKNIIFKMEWEISEADWLSFAITPDDKPIIPIFVKDPPVNRVMERLKRFEK